MKVSLIRVALLAVCLSLSACPHREGPAERTGRAIDNAGESIGEAVEDTGDAIEDAAR